jgi:hypothetical protein
MKRKIVNGYGQLFAKPQWIIADADWTERLWQKVSLRPAFPCTASDNALRFCIGKAKAKPDERPLRVGNRSLCTVCNNCDAMDGTKLSEKELILQNDASLRGRKVALWNQDSNARRRDIEARTFDIVFL